MNDFSWVWTGQIHKAEKLNPEYLRMGRETKPPAPCRGVKVILRGKFATEPKKIFDAVTGEELNFTKTGDKIRVDVPEFEALAVVVAEY